MELRCTYCQTMFAISHDEMLAALEHMEEHKQIYYDAHCPKCRRANRVERARMERFFPNWREKLKAMAKEVVQAEAPALKDAAAQAKEKAPATATPKVKPAAASKTPVKAAPKKK